MQGSQVVRSWRGLLRLLGCSSRAGVEEVLGNETDFDLYLDDLPECDIVVWIERRGTGLSFPFTMNELYATIEELDLLASSECAYEGLADEIGSVEGFEVAVAVAYECDETKVPPQQARQWTDGGEVVQFPHSYPYVRAMAGHRTIADWIERRSLRQYPGLQVALVGPAGKLPHSATLAAAREACTHSVRG